MLEATKRGFDLGIGCELAELGLRQSFQHSGKMRGIDLLWLSLVTAESEHRERDFVLAVRRQAPHSFQRLFEQLCHEVKDMAELPEMEGRPTKHLFRRNPPLLLEQGGGLRCANPPYDLLRAAFAAC